MVAEHPRSAPMPPPDIVIVQIKGIILLQKALDSRRADPLSKFLRTRNLVEIGDENGVIVLGSFQPLRNRIALNVFPPPRRLASLRELYTT